jgi:protein SCO1/2
MKKIAMKLRLFITIIFVMAPLFEVHAIGVGKKQIFAPKDGQTKNQTPPELKDVGIVEHLGDQVDLDLTFFDEEGNEVKLGKYFSDGKPVLLALVYYECPTLCNLHLNAMLETFNKFNWQIGDKFNFVTVSIDPNEPPKLAKMKKKSYLEKYNKAAGAENGWRFLTGKEENIKKLAKQVGFKYRKSLMEDDQFVHSAAAYVLTPEGKISFYHYGIQIRPSILRLSLVEASDNKIGDMMDRLVLYCIQYDPNKKTYGFYAFNIMRVVALFLILGLGIYFGRFYWKERKTKGM